MKHIYNHETTENIFVIFNKFVVHMRDDLKVTDCRKLHADIQ